MFSVEHASSTVRGCDGGGVGGGGGGGGRRRGEEQ